MEAVLQALGRSYALIAFQPDGTIVEANDAFLAAMGYRRDEVLGKHHRIFMDPREAASAEYAAFWDKLRRGAFHKGEYRRVVKSGVDIWIDASYNPVFNEDGSIDLIVKIATDVTERRRAHDAVTGALVAMAGGDIRVRLGDEVQGEFAEVRKTFNHAMDGFEHLIRSVMQNARELNWVVDAVKDNSDSLSAMSREGADALARTSEKLRTISEKVSETSSVAAGVDEQTRAAETKAQRGAMIVGEVVDAITGIEQITAEVAKTTRVIENFAFQTKLLSINAAVEAARAGDAGRGFAVVASEVRSLAERSAEASKNIADLTRRAEAQVSAGASRTGAAGAALTEIEGAVRLVVEAIARIAQSAREQADGVVEVERSVTDLSGSLGALSSLAGDAAGQSDTLRVQARDLDSIVNRFSTRQSGSDAGYRGPERRASRQTAPPGLAS
jgi:methyl-accepting chemotaxis protein